MVERVTFYPRDKNINYKEFVVPSKDLNRYWFENQKAVYRNNYKDYKSGNFPYFKPLLYHAFTNCPGVKELFGSGFILKAHTDLYIHSFGELHDPGIRFYRKIGDNLISVNDSFEFFDTGLLDGVQPPYPDKTPRILFKYLFPYYVDTPNDTALLFLPVPYNNNNDFSTEMGILDTNLSPCINPIFWYHHHDFKNLTPVQYFFEKEGYYIKKGTPIAQLIPIKKDYLQDLVFDTNEENLKKIQKKHSLINDLKQDYIKQDRLINYPIIRSKLISSQDNKCPFHI